MAREIKSLPWVADGIHEPEEESVQRLVHLATFFEPVFDAVMDKSWVADGLDRPETESLTDLYWIADEDESIALAVVALAWVQDGIEDLEADAIQELSYIANDDVGIASSVLGLSWIQNAVSSREVRAIKQIRLITSNDVGEALRILSMPFLETLDPPDVSAVKALSQLSSFGEADFQRVMSHPTLSNGITDYWAKIVATLYGVSDTNPELIDTLLDPDQVTVEERTIDLPLAGETHLAIIRTGPGAERSMELLEHAVRHAEGYMATSFPTGYVGWLFGDAVTSSFGGTNFGTHVASLAKYDVDDGSDEAEFTGAHIAHEVAHYYWRGNSNWVDEGAAEFIESVSENARTGQPVEVTRSPCGYVPTIAALEALGVTSEDGADSAFICNYALGERLFLDLHQTLGNDSFREGLRNLYLLSQVEDEDETDDDTLVGIDHVKTAFKGVEGVDDSIVDTIAARWYDGTEPYAPSEQDTGRPNPILRTVNGRIHTAYLSTTQEGTPITTISAAEVEDWLWLLLRWDYNVGSDTEVPLELVHYYEDGFEFGRRTVTFTTDARHNNSLWSWWLGVGQSPTNPWAPGKYWLHVYNEGRKLVELEYEVTP